MKKNFFKKLSFVLALAMIISVLAPAAGAFAAAAPKLNSTKKYLHLDVDGVNEFDFNIRNKQSGWSYKWTSANTKIATVNAKNGITTAEGVGTTKVTCAITDSKGKSVKKLTATVIVRDNIKELSIRAKGNPDFAKLSVGEVYDFDRGFVTNSGSTTKTSGVTRWTVEEEGATIVANNGFFTAEKAGEYTVTARAFQSTAKYNEWVKDATKFAGNVTAEKELKVTVVASIEKLEQVNKDTLRVTFDSAVEDVAKNLTVSYLAGTTPVKQVIKEVKMDAANKVALVTMYVPFTAKTTYVVAFPGMDSHQIIAATSEVEDVVDMSIVTTEAVLTVAKAIEVKLFNKDGVDITTPDLLGRVTFKSSSDRVYYDSAAKAVTIYTKDEFTTITATFHTYKYDTATGQEVGTIERSGIIRGVEQATVSVGNLAAWTIAKIDASNVDFDKVSQSLAAEDGNVRLFVKAKKSDDKTFAVSNDADPLKAAKFTYTSSNTDVLIINPTDGTLWPVKAGQATVVVSYEDKVIDAININIGAKRTATSFTLDAYSFALSNDVDVQDSKVVKLKVEDQYGAAVATKDVSITLNAGTVSDNLIDGVVASTATEIKFIGATVTTSKTAGSYYYTVKANGMTKYLGVTVQAPSEADSAYYRLNLNNNEFDTALKADKTNVELAVKIYGYAKNNVANDVKAVTGAGFTVEVTGPNNQNYVLTNDGKLVLATTVPGVKVTKLPVGMYRIRLIGSNNQVHDIQTIEVKDTQAVPTVTVKKLVTDETSLLAAIKDCFEVKLGDANVTANITVGEVLGDGKTVYVKNVTYRQLIGTTTSFIDHTVAINTTITYK